MNNLLNPSELNYTENIIYVTKLHWISYIKPAIGMIGNTLLLFIFLVSTTGSRPILNLPNFLFYFGMLSFLYGYLSVVYSYLLIKSVRIYVTPKSLTLVKGVLDKSVLDISLNKYEGMELYQTIIGRWLNYGIFTITTGGATQSYQIENPLLLRKHIINII